MNADKKDIASGAFFIGAGLLYGSISWQSLPMGSALSMGPGYFPTVLCAILIGLGVSTVVLGLKKGTGTPFGPVPWRGIVMLSTATLIFAAYFDSLGMIPGIFAVAFLSAMSISKAKIIYSIVTSVLISIFCVVVFQYGVSLPVPLFGEFFTRGF